MKTRVSALAAAAGAVWVVVVVACCYNGIPIVVNGYSTVTPPPNSNINTAIQKSASRGFLFFFPTNDNNSNRNKSTKDYTSKPMNLQQRNGRRAALWNPRMWSKVFLRRHERHSMDNFVVASYLNIAIPAPNGELKNKNRAFPCAVNDPMNDDSVGNTNHFQTVATTLPIVIEDASAIAVSTAAAAVISSTPIFDAPERISPFARFSRKTFEKLFSERLERWSNGTNVNTYVQCESTSPLLQILKGGSFNCDATVNVDSIAFGNKFRFSGGKLQAKNLGLNLLSFAPSVGPPARQHHQKPRYPNQFELHAQNFTFRHKDLYESALIRNGLRRILTRILKNRGLSAALTVDIQAIDILDSGKISCLGQATMLFGPPVAFEVQSGIAFASRGHILTFPGLQFSLNPTMGMFFPIPDVTVDLGHNAQLLDVTIDGRNKAVHVSARVTITPEHTLQIKQYSQLSHSYGALFSVDVGRWLTQVGRFAS